MSRRIMKSRIRTSAGHRIASFVVWSSRLRDWISVQSLCSRKGGVEVLAESVGIAAGSLQDGAPEYRRARPD